MVVLARKKTLNKKGRAAKHGLSNKVIVDEVHLRVLHRLYLYPDVLRSSLKLLHSFADSCTCRFVALLVEFAEVVF